MKRRESALGRISKVGSLNTASVVGLNEIMIASHKSASMPQIAENCIVGDVFYEQGSRVLLARLVLGFVYREMIAGVETEDPR